jgi:uncharacterized protein (DUF2236 family)
MTGATALAFLPAPLRLLAGPFNLFDRVIPRELWVFGYQMYLWDMRARARRGRRVV